MARFLAKEAESLRTDPRFVAEVYTVADLLSIPLPAARRQWTAPAPPVARRCSDLVVSGQLRQAVALLRRSTGSPSNVGARRRHTRWPTDATQVHAG